MELRLSDVMIQWWTTLIIVAWFICHVSNAKHRRVKFRHWWRFAAALWLVLALFVFSQPYKIHHGIVQTRMINNSSNCWFQTHMYCFENVEKKDTQRKIIYDNLTLPDVKSTWRAAGVQWNVHKSREGIRPQASAHALVTIWYIFMYKFSLMSTWNIAEVTFCTHGTIMTLLPSLN